MGELTTDFDAEFCFAQKATDYIKLTGTNFLELLELSLDASVFNMFTLKLERLTDSLLKELPDNKIIYEKMDQVILQGIEPVKIVIKLDDMDENMFYYIKKISQAKLNSELGNHNVKFVELDEDGEEGTVYKGQWENLKPNGYGVMHKIIIGSEDGNYYEGSENGDHYEGEFVDGKRCGIGKVIFGNGNQYEGQFVDDKLQGKGVCTFPNGQQYEGDFDQNIVTGKAHITSSVYIGDIKDYQYHGKGIEILNNGGQYEGEFTNNCFDLTGTYIWPNGDRFKGFFTNDEIDGRGELIQKNGNKYTGKFFSFYNEDEAISTLRQSINIGFTGEFTGEQIRGEFTDGELRQYV